MIYMDYCATTPVDPLVLEAMLPYFNRHFGNAASRHHALGWEAGAAVDQARQQVAGLMGARAEEFVFTSGATEAINLAIKGVWETYRHKGNHVITTRVEHKAVLDSCDWVRRRGGRVTYLDVDRNGLVDLDQLADAIDADTILVSIMWANNETGVIQPMDIIGQLCAEKGVLLMSDATQALGKIPVYPELTGVQLLACSAHKMYGPKGVGGLYVQKRRPTIKLAAQLHGGGHEHGMRSGTLNVPGIVGLGQAAELAAGTFAETAQQMELWRDKLERSLLEQLAEVYVNGGAAPRLPHVSNLAFRFVDGAGLLARLSRTVALSSGSACTSGSLDPSHVLLGMGVSDNVAKSSLRLSLGRYNTEAELGTVTKAVIAAVDQLRSVSPLWAMHQEGQDMDALGWGR